jgi:hypothetical protein
VFGRHHVAEVGHVDDRTDLDLRVPPGIQLG